MENVVSIDFVKGTVLKWQLSCISHDEGNSGLLGTRSAVKKKMKKNLDKLRSFSFSP
jgi:hypothetical protein